MKNLILLAVVLCFTIHGKGQNEPELMGEITGSPYPYLSYIDHGLPKIIVNSQESIDIYNTDLSLFQSITIPEGDTNSLGRAYITRSLLDCDTTSLEYISFSGTFEDPVIRIFKDDGTLFFELEGYSLQTGPNAIENVKNLVSDESGSYIIFTPGFNQGGDKVLYKFCGQLPEALARESDGTILSGIVQQGNNNGFNAYPNPAREIIKFEYDLQGHKKANLQLFNTSGQLMKELMLGQAFDFIRLNISDLEQGTYIARITTDDGFELSEKFVKVD